MRPRFTSRATLRNSAATVALACALAALPVGAQEDLPEERSDAIVVTGTRIERSGGFNEPTPSTVFGGEQIADLGIVSAGDIVELMPQNTAFVSDAVAGITAGADVGAHGAEEVGDLQGDAPDRHLSRFHRGRRQ